MSCTGTFYWILLDKSLVFPNQRKKMSLVSILKSYPNHSVTYFCFYFGWKHTQMEANALIF